MRVVRRRARRRWLPFGGGFRWPPPRAVQLAMIVVCAVRGHAWRPWRRETEEWFEELDGPEPWAWRGCARCQLIEHVR